MPKNNLSPWPCYSEEEVNTVGRILRSNKVNYWTGEECKLFEAEFAKLVNCEFAVSLANGTVALEAALFSLGIGVGDEVIVTSRTFFASVSSIVRTGAKPVFVDIDKNSQNIDPELIQESLSNKTKAIMCVHLAGWPCDMDPILAIAEKFNLYVIEDCAQAHGASYKGRPVGSLGDIAAWSFCQDKIITTGGEGGMITTNDKDLWSLIWSLKDHGKDWDTVHVKERPSGFRWLHHSFGTNLRMTEMQAAIGRIQIQKLTEWNKKRRQNMELIWEVAKQIPNLRVPTMFCRDCSKDCATTRKCVHAAYKCYVFVEDGPIVRKNIIEHMEERGVPAYEGSCSEVYLEKAFEGLGIAPRERLPVAERLGETSLMLMCHHTLTTDDLKLMCESLKSGSEIARKGL